MNKITNKEEALKTVVQDGMKLEECSDKLQNDKEIAIKAVRNREKAMMYVSEELKCDEDVIYAALVRRTTLSSEIGIAFSFVPEHIRDNKKMVLIAIRNFGGAFQYISNKLKNDKYFLQEAALINNDIFRYSDSKYLKNKTFIKSVLNDFKYYMFRNRDRFAQYLDVTILDSKAMMKEIIEKAGFENFKYLSERLKNDKKYLLEILSIAPKIYKFLDYKFHEDKEVTLCAVNNDGMNLRLTSWALKEDKEVVLEAVKNNPHAIQFADDSLQEDEELQSYVTKDDSYYWDLVHPGSGFRYDIPMLSTIDPGYFYKYVDFMRTKEQSPDTFAKILRWD